MRIALVLVLWAGLGTGSAMAAACCVGSTSSVPTRVGECEHVVVGVGVAAEASTGSWSRKGALVGASVSDDSVIGTLGLGVRLHRTLELGTSVPMRVNHKATAQDHIYGGGVGDTRVWARWDPLEEAFDSSSPVPIFTLGVRAPTGRDWSASETVLFEDVTGLQYPAVTAGAMMERSLGKTPWSVGVTGEFGVGGGTVQPTVTTSASVGRYVGTNWTVLGSVYHTFASTQGRGNWSMQTNVGARVIRGEPRRWRGWLGAQTSVPLRWAGRSQRRHVSATTGLMIVR